MKYFFSAILVFTFSIAQSLAQPQAITSGEIRIAIKHLSNAGSVLYVAAHPDDENTRLLSYFSNGPCVNTAYLSLTRGDGGQNLIGTEQGDLLGMIRTQELMAARKLDRAQQYFSRARDFGYSKTPEETFAVWNRDSILSDVVWVVRTTRPDVILCRFPTTGEGGHGHHTASAMLALEAFAAAADPTQFSWQLKHAQVWQAKRILWNAFIRDPKADRSGYYTLDIGEYNPYLGLSYGELAGRSRSMHKSQGFGASQTRGTQVEYFKHMAGDSATDNNILQGVEWNVNRLPGAEKYAALVQQITKEFRDNAPHLSVPLLVKTYEAASEIKDARWRESKRDALKALIQQCLGLYVEATVKQKYISPGSAATANVSVLNRSGAEVKLTRVNIGSASTKADTLLGFNGIWKNDLKLTVDAASVYSTPFWLERAGTYGRFDIADRTTVANPENKPAISVQATVSIEGKPFTFSQPVIYKWVDDTEGEKTRNLEVVPPVTVNFDDINYLFAPSATQQISLTVQSFDSMATADVRLQLPAGWKVVPASQKLSAMAGGQKHAMQFSVTAPATPGNAQAKAVVTLNGKAYSYSFTEIIYPHIPQMVRIDEASAAFVCADIKITARKIGYITGAGDAVPAALRQLGATVDELTNEDLGKKNLTEYDAIVVGIRAYNTNEKLNEHQPALMQYVKQGGTMVVQYNTSNFLSSVKTQMGPYPFDVSRTRVTDELAEVTILDKNASLLNLPNKITNKDFDGWVQERGLYFPTGWEENYKPLFSMRDPGEEQSSSSTIYCTYGKGMYIYTGISFFRQLPAAVPGAYRLFANFISAKP